MKMKIFSMLAFAALLPLVSCSDDKNDEPVNSELTAKEQTFSAIANQYVDNTVIPTY